MGGRCGEETAGTGGLGWEHPDKEKEGLDVKHILDIVFLQRFGFALAVSSRLR